MTLAKHQDNDNLILCGYKDVLMMYVIFLFDKIERKYWFNVDPFMIVYYQYLQKIR